MAQVLGTRPLARSRNAVRRPAPAGVRARAGWGAFLLSFGARAGLALLVGMLLWSVVPAAAGWSSSVVMSNSMAPRLLAGDVVLVRPVDPHQLRVGQILLVDDTDHPERLRLHRLTAIEPGTGMLTLKGDANQRADSAPVPTGAVHGVAALRVPWIGSPLVWVQEGRRQLLTGAATVLAGLAVGAWCYRPLRRPPLERRAAAASDYFDEPTRSGNSTPLVHTVTEPARWTVVDGRTDTRPLPCVGDLHHDVRAGTPHEGSTTGPW